MSNLIYHYTDISAFQSMVENNEFWLTAHSYMNDEREYFEGLEILEKNIESKLYNANDQVIELVKEIIQHIKQIVIFSISFSKESDLLSQWRSYCPIEGGISIGFDSKILESSICGQNVTNNIRYLQECCYDLKHSNWVAETIAEGAVKHLEFSGDKPVIGKTLKSTFFLEMLTFLARSKNNNFKEESEVRLFTYSHKDFSTVEIPDNCNSPSIKIIKDENISFRPKKNFLVPYMKIKFPLQAIRTLTIGPSPYQKICEESMKMYLISKGMVEQCEIIKSSIPYRTL